MAKTFHFRFEALLKVRDAERQRKRLELAQAFQAERLLQEQADKLASDLSEARHQTKEAAAPGNINVDKLLDLQRYAIYLLTQAKILSQKQAEVREEVERRRLALVEADRQVRVLEKLREKQEADFRFEQSKIEQKILDEIASRRMQYANTPE